MNIEQINEEINATTKPGRALYISKYVTSSGDVKDYTVSILPDGGYKDLVRQSLEYVEEHINHIIHNRQPADCDKADWIIAVNDQLQAFKKSLDEGAEKPARTYKKEYVKQGNVYVDKQEIESGNINTVVLKNLRCVKVVCHSHSGDDGIPDKVIPRLKHILRSTLPISQFIGQLNLSPGKFEQLKAINTNETETAPGDLPEGDSR